MNPHVRHLAWLLFIFIFNALIACKVNYSFTGAEVPIDAKTVSVKYFNNIAPLAQPTLSQKITEELKNIFINQTNLKLVPTNGDLEFEGVITQYNTIPVAITGNQQAAMNRFTINIEVKYNNTKDNSKNFSTTFSRFVDFKSTENFSSIENQLVDNVVKQLVQDVFNKAFINW